MNESPPINDETAWIDENEVHDTDNSSTISQEYIYIYIYIYIKRFLYIEPHIFLIFNSISNFLSLKIFQK